MRRARRTGSRRTARVWAAGRPIPTGDSLPPDSQAVLVGQAAAAAAGAAPACHGACGAFLLPIEYRNAEFRVKCCDKGYPDYRQMRPPLAAAPAAAARSLGPRRRRRRRRLVGSASVLAGPGDAPALEVTVQASHGVIDNEKIRTRVFHCQNTFNCPTRGPRVCWLSRAPGPAVGSGLT